MKRGFSMSMLLDDLRGRGEDRYLKYPYIFDYPDSILEVKVPAFVGDFSLTATGGLFRWLRKTAVVRPFGFDQSVTEVTRDYLSLKYKLPLKIRKAQIDATKDIPGAPLMALPGSYGDGVYIDIKSAYWQIVRAVGWDVEYFPGRYVAVGSSHEDAPEFLVKQKLFRASMVSMCRTRDAHIYDGVSSIYSKSMSNPYVNYRLLRFVMDVLNGIAWEMSKKIVALWYVNTDGYIVSRAEVGTAISILTSWGLEFDIKGEGVTKVWGAGSYRVGSLNTRRPGNNLSINNLTEVNYEWLKMRFRRFVELYDLSN